MSNIIAITDFDTLELDVYARLSEAQLLNRFELEKGVFIAESPKVIERVLDAGRVPVSVLVEQKHVKGQGKPIIERCGNIPVYTAEFDVLTNGSCPKHGCGAPYPRMQQSTVRIPMSHGVDSLNVAAASAVAFWELGGKGIRSHSR